MGSKPSIEYIYPEITEGKPNEVGVSSKLLSLVDDFIEDETKGIDPITGEDMIENSIVTGEFPGATLAVVKDGKIIKESSYGNISLWDKYEKIESPIETSVDTLYDVASNTKMFATNYALMKLVYEGKLDIDDKVNKYLPHYKDNENSEIKGKDNVTIRNLLYHNAGHEPSIEFYDKDRAGDLYAITKEDTIRVLGEVPLIYEVGTEVRYSDLDYMILGHIIEVITEMTLDKYVEENIYRPLGLERTCFNPLDKGFVKEEIAATERNGNTRDDFIDFENVREYTLQGEVHDEKAFYSMEGVSGHAGLFSTAKELAILSQVLLNGGSYGDVTLFDEEVIDEFIKPSYTNPSWGLGWNIQDGERNRSWMFSPYTYNTVGHTGWTGTLTSIDFENDVIVVLLTNQRNTPCPEGNFEAMKYETGRYGSITTLVYEAILKESKSKKSKLEGITDYENMNSSQTDFIFPDENPSSRVLVRDKRGFYGYEGLGNMTIENEGAESFDIFINGNKVKLKRNYNNKKFLEVNIGEYVVTGVNTIHVDNIKPEGSKVNVKLEYPEVVVGSFKYVNIEEENIELVKKIIEEELNYGLNGASLALAKEGVLYESASYGSFSEELINLGNATEIYSTLLAVNKLIYEEKLSYSDNISEFLDVDKDISIKNLLEHTSGLPNKIEYENIKDKSEFISKINNLELRSKEYEYSEYNYILLGLIVEKISGESLDDYVEQNIYKPLGLKETGYSKENNESNEKEEFNNRVFGGVSGGYGLYSTVEELVVLSQVIINYGGYGSVKLFDKDTTAYSISPISSSMANAQGFLRVAGTSNIDRIGPYGDSKFIGFESDTGLNIIIDIYSSNIIIFGSEYENNMLLSAKGENILSLLYESLISYEREEDFLEDLINDSEIRYEEDKTENNLKALEAIKKIED